jgi:diguanylate cyclase (GGDEF)-like protein
VTTGEQRSEERYLTRRHAFVLIRDIQAGNENAYDELLALAEEARSKGWDDVARVGLLGRTVRAWLRRDPDVIDNVMAMIHDSERAGDIGMLALGLALRSDAGLNPKLTSAASSDLARAVVLLDEIDGAELERITAHTACGIAFANRSLFELASGQYELAATIGEKEPPGSVDFLLAPIMFNHAELLVVSGSVLRQLGDSKGVARCWSQWQEVTGVVDRFEIPPSWKRELNALGYLLAAMAGVDNGREAEMLLDSVLEAESERRSVGLLQLAIAFSNASERPDVAAIFAARATSSIDPEIHPQIHDLALCLSAELAAADGETSGLRYGRRQFKERWATRLESLHLMEASIEAERLSHEHAVLSAHALLDDLTEIGNRRALDRYVSDLPRRGVHNVAVIIIDIDGFKSINDSHGHIAGDSVLVAIARALGANVRSTDLAVRIGGDEFAAVLAGADLDTASDRARRILEAVERHSFESVSSGLHVTLSAGVAVGATGQLDDLWAQADAAMYRAKKGSRRSHPVSRVATAPFSPR